MELSKEQLVSRIISTKAEIDFFKFRPGQLCDEEFIRLCKCAEELRDSGLIIDDTPGISVDEIYAKSLKLRDMESIDMVIVDYLQLVSVEVEKVSRQQEMDEIVRKLKMLAREIDVPVMALSQLPRTVEHREDKHPMLSDLRESGAIGQVADTVMFIYRDDYYNENSKYKELAEIIIAKNKTGNIGSAYLEWDPKNCKFRNYDDELPSESGKRTI